MEDEVIPEGTSGFQIKSSDLTPKECRKELHKDNTLSEPIKPEIKRILDNEGTYVLVLFTDISKSLRTRREQAIKKELQTLGYNNDFRLYTASQIIGFAERYPGLVLRFKNQDFIGQPYVSWSDNADISNPEIFIYDDDRKKWIEEIREELRNSEDECLIYRITGLSGVGKTRFVHELLSQDDLKNQVLYSIVKYRFN